MTTNDTSTSTDTVVEWYVNSAEWGDDVWWEAGATEYGGTYVDVNDPLSFHFDRIASDARAVMFDGDGDLTEEALKVAADILSGIAPEGWTVYVDRGDWNDKESWARFTFGNDAYMTGEEAGDTIMQIVAAVSNVTNPGTWGSSYLFDDLARQMMGENVGD